MAEYQTLRETIFERFDTSNKVTWKSLSLQYGISVSKLRTAYTNWHSQAPESQPESTKDIHFEQRSPGRSCAVALRHELILIDAINYFAGNCTPLAKNGVLDLVEDFINLLPISEQQKIGFKNNRPSIKYCDNLLARHGIEYRAVRQVEYRRVDAMTPENVNEHIARVQAAMNRYHIHDPKFIFNMDQTGSSFEKITCRSLRKGVGVKGQKLVQKTIRTKGNLDRVTVIPVVSFAGKAFTPAVIYPGKCPHYRVVGRYAETLHDVLMDCKLYHRDLPGADSAIVYDWAKTFVKETEYLREKNQHLLLILDGYSAHLQYNILELFRRNNIITIALPSHSSHELQPLDVTVFGAFKSYLQQKLHRASRVRSLLKAFDIGSILNNAYSLAFVVPTIREGFVRCGVWDPETRGINIQRLHHLFEKKEQHVTVTLDQLLSAHLSKHRSLLRDVNVGEQGRVKIDTRTGAHITSEVVIDALKRRQQQRQKQHKDSQRKSTADVSNVQAYKEPAADIRRLGELADRRAIQRKRLRESRSYRRLRMRASAAIKAVPKDV